MTERPSSSEKDGHLPESHPELTNLNTWIGEINKMLKSENHDSRLWSLKWKMRDRVRELQYGVLLDLLGEPLANPKKLERRRIAALHLIEKIDYYGDLRRKTQQALPTLP